MGDSSTVPRDGGVRRTSKSFYGVFRYWSVTGTWGSLASGRDSYHLELAMLCIVAVEDKGRLLNIHFGLTPLISLLAGILILIMPKLLNYIVAFYLIAIGLIGLLGIHQLHLG